MPFGSSDFRRVVSLVKKLSQPNVLASFIQSGFHALSAQMRWNVLLPFLSHVSSFSLGSAAQRHGQVDSIALKRASIHQHRFHSRHCSLDEPATIKNFYFVICAGDKKKTFYFEFKYSFLLIKVNFLTIEFLSVFFSAISTHFCNSKNRYQGMKIVKQIHGKSHSSTLDTQRLNAQRFRLHSHKKTYSCVRFL